jgi:hypothetical protein
LSFLAINPALSSGTGLGDILQCMDLGTVSALRRAPRLDRSAPARGAPLPGSWQDSMIDTHPSLNISGRAPVPASYPIRKVTTPVPVEGGVRVAHSP